MSADSSMGATTSNNIDATSQNDINDGTWDPVGDSPIIAPVSATTEIPPIEEVPPVEPAEAAEPAKEAVDQEQDQELESESDSPQPVPTVQETLAAVQEILSTSISNLKVDLPVETSDSEEDMPPLISSSDEEDESNTDSKTETDESKDESENSEETEEDEDMMIAVFPRPTCPRCDAALKALLTPSEEESETDSLGSETSGSDSTRLQRLRPKPTEIPTIILTLFKILLFLHVVQFLTNAFAPVRSKYS